LGLELNFGIGIIASKVSDGSCPKAFEMAEHRLCFPEITQAHWAVHLSRAIIARRAIERKQDATLIAEAKQRLAQTRDHLQNIEGRLRSNFR
jgi:hypothetical protein